jgi:hypothetical protein
MTRCVECGGIGKHSPECSGPVQPRIKPRIVCLCGSSRFITQVALKAWEFEKKGVLALSMHLLPEGYGFPPHHAAEAAGTTATAILDELHLRKIDMCDFVYVMNVGGYIGERTRYEIDYARKIGKPVDYLNPGLAGR